MKNLLILSLLIIFVCSCNQNKNKRTKATDFIPENASFVLNVNSKDVLSSDINNNSLIDFTDTTKNNSLKSLLSKLNYFNAERQITIAFDSDDTYTIITRNNDSLLYKDTINIDFSKHKKSIIKKTRIENDTLFNSVIDSFFVVSENKKNIESIINNKTPPNTLNNFEQLKSKTSMSLYTISDETISTKSNLLGNRTILHFDFPQDNLSLSGITKSNDSIPRVLAYLANTNAKKNQLPLIVPSSSKSFTSYTFDDFSRVTDNYEVLNQTTKLDSLNSIQDLIIEIGTFNLENNKVFAIRSIDVEAITEHINFTPEETFRQIEINEIDADQQLNHLFHPLVDYKNSEYCFALDDFLVFTKSVKDAKNIISSYTNKSTYGDSDVYENVLEQISDESSILHFSVASELDSVIANNLPDKLTKGFIKKNLKKNHSQVIQLINDNGFSHVNMLIQPLRKKAASKTVTEEFNLTLDNDLLNNPQFVKNHITGQKEIIVQDIENNLYLISNRGKILWKKKINGHILGEIEQIDIYKNGRLQLAFVTPSKLYVLDRNGKSVTPFPMAFNDEITQPLSVFDYDRNKDYRFLITQGKNTFMYDKKGKKVRGFNFESASSAIITKPKHFRVGSKDYIVFGAGRKMYILNRKGQTRITAKEAIDFSKNDIYLYRGNFATTNAKGQLVQVDNKGGVSKQNLTASGEHYFSATSKTIIALTDNKLTIKSKSIELDFGDYTAPNIFYLNDKIYVSVTDLQTQKTHLFDSQSKQITNFPVYGNSPMELDNIDKDKNLEFVVKGDTNALILYQMN